jgi:hypothetical protein
MASLRQTGGIGRPVGRSGYDFREGCANSHINYTKFVVDRSLASRRGGLARWGIGEQCRHQAKPRKAGDFFTMH